MADDAIQQDVSETKGEHLSEQQSALERIAATVHEGHKPMMTSIGKMSRLGMSL